jgi:hypothetical protein
MIAANISGSRNSQEASSDFVTVTKSDPKKTRVIPMEKQYRIQIKKL